MTHPTKRAINITRETHYAEDDTGFHGDYYAVVLLDGLGEEIAAFGDAYHDKGLEKSDGFLAGAAYGFGREIKVVERKIASGRGTS